MIPSDAVGILAWSNSDPLEYLNTTVESRLYEIVEKSETWMRVSQKQESTHSGTSYLGAIVSADRSIVYWVNETRPLP